jgi:hypothetical protein
MRELKDIRSLRALRAEQYLQRSQMSPEIDSDVTEAAERDESVVVEMPNRKPRTADDTEEVPPTASKPRKRSSRQKQASTKQKQTSTSANRSWEVTQKVDGDESAPAVSGRSQDVDVSDSSLRGGASSGVEKTVRPDVVTRSPHPYSARLSKPLQAFRVEQAWDVPRPINEELQQVESQMRRINQLSNELETAMVELKAIAHEMNREHHQDVNPTVRRSHGVPAPGNPLPTSPMQQFQTPPSYGAAQSTNFAQAEQDAAVNAQTLRYLANRERPHSSARVELPTTNKERRVPVRRRTLKYYLQQLQKFLQLPSDFSGLLINTGVWVLSSAAISFGLKLLMISFPWLVVPLTILKIVPAMLAAYLALFVPNAGAISGYRLLLVMVGFWLGSKLG